MSDPVLFGDVTQDQFAGHLLTVLGRIRPRRPAECPEIVEVVDLARAAGILDIEKPNGNCWLLALKLEEISHEADACRAVLDAVGKVPRSWHAR